MELQIRINLDNAAFADSSNAAEIGRCLTQVSWDVADAGGGLVIDNRSGIIRDSNGNSVGEWNIIN